MHNRWKCVKNILWKWRDSIPCISLLHIRNLKEKNSKDENVETSTDASVLYLIMWTVNLSILYVEGINIKWNQQVIAIIKRI